MNNFVRDFKASFVNIIKYAAPSFFTASIVSSYTYYSKYTMEVAYYRERCSSQEPGPVAQCSDSAGILSYSQIIITGALYGLGLTMSTAIVFSLLYSTYNYYHRNSSGGNVRIENSAIEPSQEEVNLLSPGQ